MKNRFAITAALLAAASAASAAQPELAGIFDGSGRGLDTASLLSGYTVPAPLPPAPARPRMLYEVLAEQEEGKRSLPTMQEIQLMLHRDYGNQPDKAQAAKLNDAILALKGTKFGDEMCAAVAYECTPESLKKAGIVIYVKDFTGDAANAAAEVPPPVRYAGQIYIGVNKKFLQDGAGNKYSLAVTLTHEMSHIEDLKDNKLGTLAKALYATEDKAFMKTLEIYDEVSRANPECSSEVYSLMLDYWKWKNEDGPYPRQRVITLVIGNKPMVLTTGDFINRLLPGISFMEGMKSLVYALYRPLFGDKPSVDPELVKRLQKRAYEASSQFKLWRNPPPPPQQPVTPPQPVQPSQPVQPPQPVQPTQPVQPSQPVQPTQPVQPPQTHPIQPPNHDGDDDDNDGGGGGGGGGEVDPPFIPNPHFHPWQ